MSRRPKLVELCAPLTPMQFNDLYCLARPQVAHLELRRGPAERLLTEHVAGLKYYDRIYETILPIESRLRAEMERRLGKQWCAQWSEGCRTMWMSLEK